MLISALNVKHRDIGIALPVLMQLWMFVSPVVYSSAVLLPGKWQRLYALNPLVGIIEGFRVALLGGNSNPRVAHPNAQSGLAWRDTLD